MRPRSPDQLVAADGLARAGYEHREQPKLCRRQRNARSIGKRCVRDRIEPESSDLDSCVDSCAAKERANACGELGDRERLRQVIVTARAEAGEAIGECVARRQEEDRRLSAARAKRLDDVTAVGVRKPNVDDEQVRRLALEALKQLTPGSDTARRKAFFVQAADEDTAQLGVVFDDQDAVRNLHTKQGTRRSEISQEPFRPMSEIRLYSARLMLPQTTALRGREMLNKVPEVTLYFWIIKVLCTTVGETASDYLGTNLNLGLTNTTYITGSLLLITLFFQFRSTKYVPSIYWLAVVLISVVGTQITDNLVDNFGVGLVTTTIAFSIALAAVFAAWYWSERTLSIHSIYTTRREAFYWLAILFTFALGTAAGDLAAERINLGYWLSAVMFAGLIALVVASHYGLKWHLAAEHRRLTSNAVLAFWLAYILTRPLGASIGDFLSQSRAVGGLGLGTTVTSALFLATIVAVVTYLSVTRKDTIETFAAIHRADESDEDDDERAA